LFYSLLTIHYATRHKTVLWLLTSILQYPRRESQWVG
jgi:hypothetical protein